MSANEIELTFIRCQNCKSLMPSTAQACGMCGFKKGESQDGKSKVRLRQESDVSINETISEEKNRESDRSENVTQEMESPFHEDSREKKQNTARRDYLNFGESNPPNSSEDEESSDDDDHDSDDFNDDEHSENTDHPQSGQYNKDESSSEERPKKKKRRRKKKQSSQMAIDTSGLKDNSPSERPNERSSESSRAPENRSEREPELPKKEINFRNDPQPSKQDFKPRDEVMQHSDKQDDRQQEYSKDDSRDQNDRSDSNRRNDARNNDRPNDNVKHHSNPRQDHVRHEQTRPDNDNHNSGPRAALEEGKLMGWLVNYTTNGKGASFELRIGRRFIGRQALRSDDIVIQDSALSTPHSLIQIEGGQVFLQDLMSENGTFVKNSGSKDFVRKDATTRLMHGDVIRLGSYELIVCLVPST